MMEYVPDDETRLDTKDVWIDELQTRIKELEAEIKDYEDSRDEKIHDLYNVNQKVKAENQRLKEENEQYKKAYKEVIRQYPESSISHILRDLKEE